MRQSIQSNMWRRQRRTIWGSSLLLLLLGSGCAPDSSSIDRANSHPAALDTTSLSTQDTVYLFPGYAAVIPVPPPDPLDVALPNRDDADARRPERARPYIVELDDVPIAASLYRLSVEPADPEVPSGSTISPVLRATSIAALASAWMGQSIGGRTTRWVATPASAIDWSVPDAAQRSGTWVIVLPPTTGSESPGRTKVLRVGDRTLNAVTMPALTSAARAGESSSAESLPAWVRAAVVDESRRESPWAVGAMAALAASPAQRWRVRLATGTALGSAAPPRDMFLDPVLETLATQVEHHWYSALDRLAEEDEPLAAALARSLSRIVDFGGGISVPVHDADSVHEAALLAGLRSPSTPKGELANMARTWLEARPAALAWVADDAGGSAADKPIPHLAVANLSDSPLVVWAGIDGVREPGELAAIDPDSVRIFPATAGAKAVPLGEPRAGVVISVRAGAHQFRRRAAPLAVSASPPGCTIGPLLPDWTARSLLASGASLTEGADPGPWGANTIPSAVGAGSGTQAAKWLTAGRVYLGSAAESPVIAPGANESAGQWMLYLECLRDPAEAGGFGPLDTPPDGFLRVWIGPTGTPSAIYKVLWTGQVIDETPGAAPGRAGDIAARVALESTRLSCWIPLPVNGASGAKGEGDADPLHGLLHIGIERMDERGVHSAWPRAMMPWQAEPARAVIDLAAWKRVAR